MANSGLLTQGMTVEQAQILDQRLRKERDAPFRQPQGNYGGGALGGLLSASGQAINSAALAGRNIGEAAGDAMTGREGRGRENEIAAVERQNAIKAQEQEKLAATSSNNTEHAISLLTALVPQLGEKQVNSMIQYVKADTTGKAAQQAVAKYGTPDIKTGDRYKAVGGTGLWDTVDKVWVTPPEGKETEKAVKNVGDKYGIAVKDLSTTDQARLAIQASELEAGTSTPNEITVALNQSIIDMADVSKQQGLASMLSATDNLITNAKKAKEVSPESFTEAAGDAISGILGIPWTDGVTLGNYVEQIQANLAFDRLQEMRDASATGGALGQVSNIELGLLKAALTGLDVKDKNFNTQLDTVIEHYSAFAASLRGKVPDSSRYAKHDGSVYQVDSEGNWFEIGEGK